MTRYTASEYTSERKYREVNATALKLRCRWKGKIRLIEVPECGDDEAVTEFTFLYTSCTF